jgi:hypothetical protein
MHLPMHDGGMWLDGTANAHRFGYNYSTVLHSSNTTPDRRSQPRCHQCFQACRHVQCYSACGLRTLCFQVVWHSRWQHTRTLVQLLPLLRVLSPLLPWLALLLLLLRLL